MKILADFSSLVISMKSSFVNSHKFSPSMPSNDCDVILRRSYSTMTQSTHALTCSSLQSSGSIYRNYKYLTLFLLLRFFMSKMLFNYHSATRFLFGFKAEYNIWSFPETTCSKVYSRLHLICQLVLLLLHLSIQTIYNC